MPGAKLLTALKWRKPSDTELMQCYHALGYSCYAVKQIRTIAYCAPASPIREVLA